jgi:hypothetical protein
MRAMDKIQIYRGLAVSLVLSCIIASSFASSLIVTNRAGKISELKLNELEVVGATDLGQLPVGGRIIAARDFDVNGSTDLVLEYDPDGAGPRVKGTFLWDFDGETRTSVKQLGGVSSSYTVPVGTCDMDKDGSYEYAMANPRTGFVKLFEITKLSAYDNSPRQIIAGGRGNFSQVVGIGDVNADHNVDLLLQDPASKRLCYRYFTSEGTSRLSKPLKDVPTQPVSGLYDPFIEEVGGEFETYSGIVFPSSDGISPRIWWYMMDLNHAGNNDFYGDASYRDWTIVAIVQGT